MNRFLLPAGIFAALVALLFVGIQRAPNKSVIASPLIDKPAPQFELPVLGSEETFANASMRGRWYLLNVWGTWCAECRREHDMLLEIASGGEIPIDLAVALARNPGEQIGGQSRLVGPEAREGGDLGLALLAGLEPALGRGGIGGAGAGANDIGPLPVSVALGAHGGKLPPEERGGAADQEHGQPGSMQAEQLQDMLQEAHRVSPIGGVRPCNPCRRRAWGLP